MRKPLYLSEYYQNLVNTYKADKMFYEHIEEYIARDRSIGRYEKLLLEEKINEMAYGASYYYRRIPRGF